VTLYAEKDAFMYFHENIHANIQNEWSVIIEMQAKGHLIFDERSMFYVSYTFSNQFSNDILYGKDWFELIWKVYAIQLLYYDTNIMKAFIFLSD
jgi:hypothetical protein